MGTDIIRAHQRPYTPMADLVLDEALVRYVASVPEATIDELLTQARDLFDQAANEAAWDNPGTASVLRISRDRYLVAAAMHGSDDESACRTLQIVRDCLRHRLIRRHVMLEEDDEGVALSTPNDRHAWDDAIGKIDLSTALALVDELGAAGELTTYVGYDDDGEWLPITDDELEQLKERHRDGTSFTAGVGFGAG